MNIFNEEELYRHFKQIIDRITTKEIELLENEIETLRLERTQQMSFNFEKRKDEDLTNLEKRIDIEYREYLSGLEQNIRRNITKYREELVDDLMSNLEKEFLKYQKTAKYEEVLNNALNNLAIDSVAFIEISEKDLVRIKNIDEKILKVNPEIKAGYRVFMKTSNILVDETLTTKINQARSWFYENASLSIEINNEEVGHER